ncbi:MAG: nucleoside hydrolase [Actinobacteria bacterium]|nr:nucleoside hydrolase [Actinomycetota bacterium]
MRETILILVAACAILSLAGCTSETNDDPAVILSMDLAMGLTSGNANGTMPTPSDYDDTWALPLLRDAPNVNVLGIVVTMGNGPLAQEMVVARESLDKLKMDVPLFAGAATWLPMVATEDYAGVDLSSSCVNDGVRFMADALGKNSDVTILATGPMTDVACLILAYPDEASNIKEIVALIGGKPGPVIYAGKPARDFNYSLDPRALSVILDESKIPFTAVTFEASSSAAMPTNIVDTLAASSDPTEAYFGRASQAYTDWWESSFGPTKPIWDAVAVWKYLHPEDFDCAPARYELQLGPPNLGSDKTHDWFIADPKSDGRVTACMSFVDQAAIDRMNDAVLSSLGGD